MYFNLLPLKYLALIPKIWSNMTLRNAADIQQQVSAPVLRVRKSLLFFEI